MTPKPSVDLGPTLGGLAAVTLVAALLYGALAHQSLNRALTATRALHRQRVASHGPRPAPRPALAPDAPCNTHAALATALRERPLPPFEGTAFRSLFAAETLPPRDAETLAALGPTLDALEAAARCTATSHRRVGSPDPHPNLVTLRWLLLRARFAPAAACVPHLLAYLRLSDDPTVEGDLVGLALSGALADELRAAVTLCLDRGPEAPSLGQREALAAMLRDPLPIGPALAREVLSLSGDVDRGLPVALGLPDSAAALTLWRTARQLVDGWRRALDLVPVLAATPPTVTATDAVARSLVDAFGDDALLSLSPATLESVLRSARRGRTLRRMAALALGAADPALTRDACRDGATISRRETADRRVIFHSDGALPGDPRDDIELSAPMWPLPRD